MADVFAADVYQLASANSASLGAALRAFHADRLADGAPIPWDDVVVGLAGPIASTRVAPMPANVAAYRALRPRFRALLADAGRA